MSRSRRDEERWEVRVSDSEILTKLVTADIVLGLRTGWLLHDDMARRQSWQGWVQLNELKHFPIAVTVNPGLALARRLRICAALVFFVSAFLYSCVVELNAGLLPALVVVILSLVLIVTIPLVVYAYWLGDHPQFLLDIPNALNRWITQRKTCSILWMTMASFVGSGIVLLIFSAENMLGWVEVRRNSIRASRGGLFQPILMV